MATWTISDTGGNWNATAAWAEGGGYPVAGDTVVATGTSGPLTVNVGSACAVLNLTGYTNTMTFTSTLTVSGAVTLGSGMTIAGSGKLTCNTTASLTSNGVTFSGTLEFAGSTQTFTLADGWVVGVLSISGTSPIINTNTISAAGLTVNANCTGTAAVTLTGGTWSGDGSYFGPSLTLAGNITISGTVGYKLGTLAYSSGTITLSGSTIKIGDSCTINSNGLTWATINPVVSGKTITLSSLLLADTLSFGDVSTTFAGAYGFTVGTLSAAAGAAARTLTLTQTNTYTVTSALNFAGSASYYRTIASSSATLLVPFIFSGATQAVDYVKTTRVDSSGGNTIYDPNWVDNDPAHPTLNWEVPAAGATPNTMRNVHTQAVHRAATW